MNLLVISDVHGCARELEHMLDRHYQAKTEQLVVLGDLVDRGPNSLRVIQQIMALAQNNQAIVVGGNHDSLLIDWLDNPAETDYYYQTGGKATIDSFCGKGATDRYLPAYLSAKIQQEFTDEIAFMRNLPSYWEYENYLFVHAGVDLNLADWRNSSENVLKQTRTPFHRGKNQTGKTIFFGHTPTRLLRADGRDDVWQSACQTKYGLDGSCEAGGQLNGLKITPDGMESVFIPAIKSKI